MKLTARIKKSLSAFGMEHEALFCRFPPMKGSGKKIFSPPRSRFPFPATHRGRAGFIKPAAPLADLLEKRRESRPRARVMAAYQASHERYAPLYKKLAE